MTAHLGHRRSPAFRFALFVHFSRSRRFLPPPHDDADAGSSNHSSSSSVLHIAAQPQEQVEFPRMEFAGGSNGECWGQLHMPIYNTGYSFEMIGSHPGFVGGCIKRHLMHVSIIFRKAGTADPIRDLHLAHWRQNNQYCLGAYISPTKWSKCTCFNNPSNWKSTQLARDFSHELKNVIREALESTGMFMNQNAAAITAAGLTPIIIWALPIPPPPL